MLILKTGQIIQENRKYTDDRDKKTQLVIIKVLNEYIFNIRINRQIIVDRLIILDRLIKEENLLPFFCIRKQDEDIFLEDSK